MLNRDQKLEIMQGFNLFSDVFISVVLQDAAACGHVLQIITGDKDIVVKEVRTQYVVSKAVSHGARLDVLAEDSRGRLYNLEIQRADTEDHARRIRFYGSMVDTEFFAKGLEYYEVPDVSVIYISETDIYRRGSTVSCIKKIWNNTEEVYKDGQRIIYVNAQVDDGTEAAELMKYFKTADPDDMSQGALSQRVRFLKSEEGGHEIMCKISDQFIQIGKQEGKQEIALNLAAMGMAMDSIARAVNESIEVVQGWLDAETALV